LLAGCAGPQAEGQGATANPESGGKEAAQKAPAEKAADPNSCNDPKDCLNKGARANQNKDFASAAKFLAPACEIEPKACNIVGELYRRGEGVGKDAAKAAEFHGKACDKGLILSCAVEAQLRYQGAEGLQPDKARARIAFEKSCSPEFLDSCVNAAVMYNAGDGGPADKEKARALHQKGCDGGEQNGCVNAAAMYLNGDGGPADKPRAKALFEQACEKKNMLGCFNAGLVYAKGLDGAQDLGKAIALLQQACDGGNQKGCEVVQQIRDDQAKQQAAQAKPAGKPAGKKK
jgi:hypothetical protein